MKYVLLFFLIVFSAQVNAECPLVSNSVELLIEEHVKFVNGNEYCRFRTAYKQNNIELVLYTIEGACYENSRTPGGCGNHYFRSMVGVVNGKKFPPIVIGGKGVFQSKDLNYYNGIITINGLAHKKSDSQCCPSINSQRNYKIGLVEFEPIEQ